MSDTPQGLSEYQAIARTIQYYIDGAISGRVEDLRPAFHADATIFGYVGPDLFASPIQDFYDWHTQNGPATGLEFHTTSIDIGGSVATVRLELNNWTGHRFTDMFTLLKVDGEWKIMNKVFHMHA